MEAYFNTSHVNVNPKSLFLMQRVMLHFNTSHVNVNQKLVNDTEYTSHISIHLMLMLIDNIAIYCPYRVLFQYISC